MTGNFIQEGCWQPANTPAESRVEAELRCIPESRRRENRAALAVAGTQRPGWRFKHQGPGQRPEGAASSPSSRQRREEASGKGAPWAAGPAVLAVPHPPEQIPVPSLPRLPAHTPQFTTWGEAQNARETM